MKFEALKLTTSAAGFGAIFMTPSAHSDIPRTLIVIVTASGRLGQPSTICMA